MQNARLCIRADLLLFRIVNDSVVNEFISVAVVVKKSSNTAILFAGRLVVRVSADLGFGAVIAVCKAGSPIEETFVLVQKTVFGIDRCF